MRPLDKYRRFITSDLAPQYIDDEIAVLGVNTARSLTFKNGRIALVELDRLRTQFAQLPSPCTKIIVTHHPFDLPEHLDHHKLVGRSPAAMALFSDCGADVLLAGHLHASHAGSSAARYPAVDYAALVVQAGTATSTRARGESNSFNVLRVDQAAIAVERYHWREAAGALAGHFALATTESFVRINKVWQKR